MILSQKLFFFLNQNMQQSKLFPQKQDLNTEIQRSVNSKNNYAVTLPNCVDYYGNMLQIGVVCTKSNKNGTGRGCLQTTSNLPLLTFCAGRGHETGQSSCTITVCSSTYCIKKDFKPGEGPTVPCSGGRTTSQNPTSDEPLHVRTGRRVRSKYELTAFISSNVINL